MHTRRRRRPLARSPGEDGRDDAATPRREVAAAPFRLLAHDRRHISGANKVGDEAPRDPAPHGEAPAAPSEQVDDAQREVLGV